MKQESVWGIIFVFFLFNYVLLYFKNCKKQNSFQQIPDNRRFFIFLLLTFVGIVGLQQGDYYGYWEEIKEIAQTPDSYGKVTHLESQYEYLARRLHGNYFLWRLIIFGGQFAILVYYLRKLKFFTYGYLYVFTIICLHAMVVGRSSWGMVLFFCATMYAVESKKYFHLLLALLCVFSHTTLLILPALLPLLFFRVNKKSIILYIILYMGFSIALRYVFDNIPLLAAYEQTEVVSQKMESYTDENRANSIGFFGNSLGSKLFTIPQKMGSLALLLILFVKSYKHRREIDHIIQFMLLASLFLVMFSFVMLLGNFGSGTLSYRFFDMIQLPLSFAFYYFYKNKFVSKKFVKVFLSIFVFSLEMSLIVPLYYVVL